MNDIIFINGNPVCDIVWKIVRGKEIPSIRYKDSWLKKGFALGPDVPLISGWQQTGSNFGFLADIAPDRWGRRMIKALNPAVSREYEYIFAGNPDFRSGAIDFLSDKKQDKKQILSINGFYDLIKKWQSGDEINNNALRLVVKAAASSGGSRPKINIRNNSGQLFIVKFPSMRDDIDVPLWEKVSLDMASACGLNVADANLAALPDGRHALISRRFDRNANGGKIHFASAMNLAGAKDGEEHSYLDIAEIIQNAGNPEELPDLWRRMVFNFATGNRDDHLRNHGFLRDKKHWILAPAYDLESDDGKIDHCLALDDKGNRTGDIDMLIEMAPYYDLNVDKARKIAQKIMETSGNWEHFADAVKASAHDKKIMENCFVNSASDIIFPKMSLFSIFL